MACIAKRRDRWVIDAYDQHGKRYRKTLPAGTTKGRAREILREVEEKIERRTFAHEKKIPVFSEVANGWLEHKRPNVRITTWEMYKGHLKHHFSDLDRIRIDMISTSIVEKWITKRQNEGMCIGMLRKIIVTFNQIMAYAVRHKLIDSNPVRDAERPRKKMDDIVKGNIAVLNPEQIRSLLVAAPDQKYRMLFLTAIMTGARQGEILGLEWSDVDFEKKQIHIRRTFNHERFFTPKTKGSIRSIDLAPMMVLELKKWKLASGGHEDELVFQTVTGNPIEAGKLITRYFKPSLKRAGLPSIRFHDLRHTYASLLLSQGENIKYISAQLGHANPTTTLNIYAHLMKTENQAAVCRLENTIFESIGHNLVTNEKKDLTVFG
ncbi:MAG: putative prophage phiRv2 integrase [Syntrophus sp. PtaU1.Bin005]|nr:MAG: putative prophage phiRv2 integrase [Syntrophus sp. PtaU1.Bin005]